MKEDLSIGDEDYLFLSLGSPNKRLHQAAKAHKPSNTKSGTNINSITKYKE